MHDLNPLRYPAHLLAVCGVVSAAFGQSLPNGGSIQAAISVAGETDTYTFSASAGQSFRIRVADIAGSPLRPTLSVLDPAGILVGRSNSPDVANVAATAAVTGTFTAVVSDGNTQSQTGSYEIFYARAPGANEGGLLPNGGSVTGTIRRGDLDSFTFAAQAGQSFHLRLADLGATALRPMFTVHDPSGAVVAGDNAPSVASVVATAQANGTYTVILGDGNTNPAATGSYRLYYALAPGANQGGALPNGSSVTGRIDLGDLDTFTFAAVAGETVSLRLADLGRGALRPTLTLYDASGASVGGDNAVTVAAITRTAPSTGTYTVVVRDGNTEPTGTGDYELHFVRVPGANEGGALQSGSNVLGTVSLGDLDTFTLSATAGEVLVLRVADLGATALRPTITLYDPTGASVGGDNNPSVAALSKVAAVSGTYTVLIRDGNTEPNGTGSYQLAFLATTGAVSGGTLPNGGAVTGSLGLGELLSFSFNANAGESVQLRAADLGATGMRPTLVLYSPMGTALASSNNPLVAAIRSSTPLSGRYTVLLADGNTTPNGTGAFKLHFTLAPGANEGGALIDGVTTYEAIERGDLDSYQFAATAGDPVAITFTDLQAGALRPAMNLYDPTGARIAGTNATTAASISQTLALTGAYTLVVFDGNTTPSATGPYSLVLDNANATLAAGCPGEPPPTLQGTPSVSTGFAVQPPALTTPCTGPAVLVFGACAPAPLPLAAGTFCTGPCGLGVFPVGGAVAGPLAVPPLPASVVGLSLCVQSVCAVGPCLGLSSAARIVAVP